jgi:glycosyltransferase involved in cell wall biosynthesis
VGNRQMKVKSIFIVWEIRSRRAESLAAELEGNVFFLRGNRLKAQWLTPVRYLVQAWKTWWLLERERPEVVVVQAPPTFAPLLVAIWCILRCKTRSGMSALPYAIDCHTGTFHRPKWRLFLPLQKLLSQHALVTIVTDSAALATLQEWKVKSLFLEDALPLLAAPTETIGSEGTSRVGVISSLDDDEPIADIFAAARLLPQVTFYITGRPERLPTSLATQKPENVVMTGYLKGSVYTSLLKNVHGLIVLTNEPHAVNCGAYEAAAMAKPAIISDWPDLRRCFPHGFIHVTNTPDMIAAGIQKILNEQEVLTTEVIALRAELLARRKPVFEEFVSLLESAVLDEHGPVLNYANEQINVDTHLSAGTD